MLKKRNILRGDDAHPGTRVGPSFVGVLLHMCRSCIVNVLAE